MVMIAERQVAAPLPVVGLVRGEQEVAADRQPQGKGKEQQEPGLGSVAEVSDGHGTVLGCRNDGVRLPASGCQGADISTAPLAVVQAGDAVSSGRTSANTWSTVMACRHLLSTQGVLRWLAALTQGEQASPAKIGVVLPSGP